MYCPMTALHISVRSLFFLPFRNQNVLFTGNKIMFCKQYRILHGWSFLSATDEQLWRLPCAWLGGQILPEVVWQVPGHHVEHVPGRTTGLCWPCKECSGRLSDSWGWSWKRFTYEVRIQKSKFSYLTRICVTPFWFGVCKSEYK